MSKTPTFVVGVGEKGVAVLNRLHDRMAGQYGDADHIELLAIDSDSQVLEQVDDLHSIYLESTEGIVDETIIQYPFLASDVTVPEEGAENLRHVGRYKLDNPVYPTYQDTERMVRARFESFINDFRTSLTPHGGIYNIILVSSLGDGTGSGTLPLFATMLRSIGDQIQSGETTVRLVGIGFLPPLELDLARSLPRVEPVSYLNTYGAFRNLIALSEATDKPVSVPVYASNRDGESDSYATAGRTITVDQQPFDLLWMVEDAPMALEDNRNRNNSGIETIADTICVFSIGTPGSSDHWSLSGPVSAFGTVGYSAIRVPHETLTDYCKLKADREEVRTKLETFVEPKLNSLRERRQDLDSVLHTDDEQISNEEANLSLVESRLDADSTDKVELWIRAGPDEIRAILDHIEEQTDISTYYQTLLALHEGVYDGEIGTELQDKIETTVTEVRTNYDFDIISEHQARLKSSPELLKLIESQLEDRAEHLRESLAETEPDIRDLVPPTNDLFTSDREQIRIHLDNIEDDLECISAVRSQHTTLEQIRSVCDERLERARVTLRQRIDQCEREISHFEAQRERLQDEIVSLNRNIASLREFLADPTGRPDELVLSLEWNAISNVDSEMLTDLTSISSYVEQDLLEADDDTIQSLVTKCFNRSRNWPETLTRQTVPIPSNKKRQESIVLYHEANETIIDDAILTLTGPDQIHNSGNQNVPFTNNPYRIEMASIFQTGDINSLLGFERLASMKEEGLLRAISTRYQSVERVLAYPEWYGPDVQDIF